MKITNTNEAAAFHGIECHVNMIKDRNKGRENGPIKAIMVPVVITNSRPSNGGYSFEVRQYWNGCKVDAAVTKPITPFGGAGYFDSSSLWKYENDLTPFELLSCNRLIPLIDDIADQGSIAVHTGNDGLPVFTQIYPEFLKPSEMGPVVQDKNGRFSQSAVVVNDEAAIAKGKARKAREKAAKTSKTS